MKIQVSGAWKQGVKTDDNFFEFTGFSSPVILSDPLPVKLTSTAGEEISDTIQYVSTINDVRVTSSIGGTQFTTSSSTGSPTNAPTVPTGSPTRTPTRTPSVSPTIAPTAPTESPTIVPTGTPTQTPTGLPTPPTHTPTRAPTQVPTSPTQSPEADVPSAEPTISGTRVSAITVETVVQFAGALSTVQRTQVKDSYRHRLETTFSAVATHWLVTLVESRRSSESYVLQGVAKVADLAEFQSMVESTATSFQTNLQAQLVSEGYTGVSVDEYSFTAMDGEYSSTSDNNSSLGSGATIAIVLSCIAVVGLGGGIGYVMYRRGTQREPVAEDVDVPGPDGVDLEAPLTPREVKDGEVVQDTRLDATEFSQPPGELEQM